MVDRKWVEWAVEAIANAEEDYQKYEDYYFGDQPLALATDRWERTFGDTFKEFADNWCQVVIDSVTQRLEIIGWEVDGADKTDALMAEDLWDSNRLHLEEGDLHTQAQVKGDGYLIVWPKPDDADKVDIVFNDALYMSVYYNPADRRDMVRAAKKFKDEKGDSHVHIYEKESIIKLISTQNLTPQQFALMGLQGVSSTDLLPIGWRVEDEEPNPFGRVPVFHFRNRALGSTHGTSELKSVVPLQNSVNKLLMDLMVASEFGSFRQKWVTGGAPPIDKETKTVGWRAGGDRVWHTTDPLAKFGDFESTDLEPIFKSIDAIVGHLAKITQTPMHYLRTSGDMPSGEALKTAESGLIKKIYARQKLWGAAWSDAMSFAIEIVNKKAPKNPVYPIWKSPETRHDLEQAQTAQLKSILGIPLEFLWSEHFGYTKEQVEEFIGKNKALAAAVLAQVVAQVGQLPPGSEAVAATPQQLIDLVNASGAVTPKANGESGLSVSQILAMLPKSVTAQTTAGESTTKPQPNTRPPASPTRRSTGFKD